MHRLLCAAILTLTSVSANGQVVFQAAPTDDVWVYPFAGDQTSDGFLRAWGNGFSAIAPTHPPAENWSYSYLRWDLSAIPNGAYRLLEATLTVTQQVSTTQPGYPLSVGLANPLQARPLNGDFNESSWSFAQSATVFPGSTVFGTGDLSGYVPRGTPGVPGFQIPIDLLAGPGDFTAYFLAAVNNDTPLSLALTSTLSPAGPGGSIYRLYSKDFPGGFGPQLRLRYQAVPEPGAGVLAGIVLLGSLCLRRRVRERRSMGS
ncbi:MAG: PEP-CTERM sorting domain-containing protein [Chloroherpetonaceae bacterium]|nr:PEP-CTERM sorting domain-containing protein [Chthonomonadaceae bacterium]MDW8207828.1 PEP-CTERM sorting domain-containing protein [Chloroherpetonaceae bacterium]